MLGVLSHLAGPGWRAGSVRRLGSANLRHDSVLSAAFTPDGRYLANGKKFHPLSAKSPPLELPIQTSRLAFSRDDRVLVAVAEDGFTLLVFDPNRLPN
ncbi:MAG: hypothetical protein L0Z62_35380 [Gemmataceae bacterium]|nr:hypothetical protein [Gemmataceae bacterium]